MSVENPRARLPFISSTQPNSAWRPATSGDWANDCAVGRGYADAAVEYVAATGDAPLIAHVAREIAARGNYGAVEIGFFTRLGSLAAG